MSGGVAGEVTLPLCRFDSASRALWITDCDARDATEK